MRAGDKKAGCFVSIQKGEIMGMWIELGIFVLVLLFGLHQIWDVKREQRKRSQQKSDPEA